jgi:hypothetical protein
MNTSYQIILTIRSVHQFRESPMRNPKPGMPTFNEEEIPNDAAEAITKYIFSSILFKK